MSEQSMEVFRGLKSAEQKFDYFMLRMTAALFAYIGER